MTGESLAALTDAARRWAAHDPDPEAAAQVLDWVAAGDETALAAAFAGPIRFGTAGLRAAIGPGESRMNRATVIRATAGLMDWLAARAPRPRVVVGCDARDGSDTFRRDVATVVSAAGGEALLLPARNPTPLTAFSVRHLGADAGVMVTASHNPPRDNGYKVYLGGRVANGDAAGVQLISPADDEIAAAIAAAPPADEVPRSEDAITPVDTRAAYIERTVGLAERYGAPESHGALTVAVTAMHGVGAAIGSEVLSRAGFRVSLVPEQAEPDPGFPTVAFPNPEEPGAIDLSIRHADRIGADLIVAYDPDADRLAIAVPTGGRWRQLTGDETGALLGEFLAGEGARGTFANSIVSSRLLSRIARRHGLAHETTLTGFKWIARTPGLAFGYEEAIGYCVDPEAVRDKDGISASVVLCCLAARRKAQGQTLLDALGDIHAAVGALATAPLTLRVEDRSLIDAAVRSLAENPPEELAGARVTSATPFAQGIILVTEGDDRVVARPSGTEPKLKCYLESPHRERLPLLEEEMRARLAVG